MGGADQVVHRARRMHQEIAAARQIDIDPPALTNQARVPRSGGRRFDSRFRSADGKRLFVNPSHHSLWARFK